MDETLDTQTHEQTPLEPIVQPDHAAIEGLISSYKKNVNALAHQPGQEVEDVEKLHGTVEADREFLHLLGLDYVVSGMDLSADMPIREIDEGQVQQLLAEYKRPLASDSHIEKARKERLGHILTQLGQNIE